MPYPNLTLFWSASITRVVWGGAVLVKYYTHTHTADTHIQIVYMLRVYVYNSDMITHVYLCSMTSYGLVTQQAISDIILYIHIHIYNHTYIRLTSIYTIQYNSQHILVYTIHTKSYSTVCTSNFSVGTAALSALLLLLVGTVVVEVVVAVS